MGVKRPEMEVEFLPIGVEEEVGTPGLPETLGKVEFKDILDTLGVIGRLDLDGNLSWWESSLLNLATAADAFDGTLHPESGDPK